MTNNIKKLLNYSYDCVRQSLKANSFNNIKEGVYIIENNIFAADDKKINEIMSKHALNKSTINLLYSELFIKNDKLYTPLLYSECELIRDGGKIKIEKEENYTLNVGAIANLLADNEEEEKIEYIINELLDVAIIDIEKVMTGLLNIDNLEFIKQNALILAKLPESTAGLLNELKKISELY